ncbi:MAG: hypothetical protein OXF27_08030, partial [Acidobacteria bacterium]|nr:hypothetical protein [Acidobacteriota bacterium]
MRRLSAFLPTVLLAAALPAAAGQQSDQPETRPSGGRGPGVGDPTDGSDAAVPASNPSAATVPASAAGPAGVAAGPPANGA